MLLIMDFPVFINELFPGVN